MDVFYIRIMTSYEPFRADLDCSSHDISRLRLYISYFFVTYYRGYAPIMSSAMHNIIVTGTPKFVFTIQRTELCHGRSHASVRNEEGWAKG